MRRAFAVACLAGALLGLGAGTAAAVPLPQTVTFSAIPMTGYGQPAFSVASYVTTSSGLPVTFSAVGACTVTAAGVVTPSGYGACTLTATQAGNASYLPAAATSVLQVSVVGINASRTVSPAGRSVTLTAMVPPHVVRTGTASISLFEVDTGKVVASCNAPPATCAVELTRPAGEHRYVGRLHSRTGEVQGVSPEVKVTWLAPDHLLTLTASTQTPGVAAPVTLTATSPFTVHRLVIREPADGEIVARCK